MIDNYIVYLRKSRADDAHESVEEVLKKHESIIQDYAIRNFGEPVREENIYREVVSGETIADRPEIKKVLCRIEDNAVTGVLVVEPQRLTRGDLIDCGTIINAFKYSNTKIITPTKVFDLSNDDPINYDEKILKMELTNGNEYLEYTKMIMNRGRLLSVQKGNYIGSVAPYGYDKAIIEGNHTLVINEEEAAGVKMVFELYNQGLGYSLISKELELNGFFPRKSKHWNVTILKDILSNETYLGKVRWNRKKEIKKMEGGSISVCRPRQKKYIVVEGKHDALISEETFNKAAARLDNNPRVTKGRKLVNPLAGIMFCTRCGRAIIYRTYKKNGVRKCEDRFLCSNQVHCGSLSDKSSHVYESLINSLNMCINDFEIELKNANRKTNRISDNRITEIEKKIKKLEDKQEELYDLLENKIYTREVFIKRNQKLALEREQLNNLLVMAKTKKEEIIDYKEKIVKFKNVVKKLNDDKINVETKNELLKGIIKRIDYYNENSELKLYITLV